ncbi:right-handed parallel beta-helix repeat-containing protein [Pseudobacteroides cellulosolvens]|nr:right-handed parallel beta-helix repeat-containing protein [Pseudobacteroides cellulosolvens]
MNMKKNFLLLKLSILTTILITGCTSLNFSSTTTNKTSVKKEAVAGETIRLKPGDDINTLISKAANGSEIILAHGRYLISKPVEIANKSNITIVGENEVWVESKKTDHQIFFVRNSANIFIKGIKAQHIVDKTKQADSKPLLDNRKGSVVDIESCSKVVFEGCELVGCGVYGIYASNTPQVHILNSYLHHNSISALGFYSKSCPMKVYITASKITNNKSFIEKHGDIKVEYGKNNEFKDNDLNGYNAE